MPAFADGRARGRARSRGHPRATTMRVAPPSRVGVSFVVQAAAARHRRRHPCRGAWTDGEPFLAMNADNLYPRPALARSRALDEPGLPAFERDDLVALQQHSARTHPCLRASRRGRRRLPDAHRREAVGAECADAMTRGSLVSMNCWRFDARIFDACRRCAAIGSRGIRAARGRRRSPFDAACAFRALPARGPVLDLSRRADCQRGVAGRLARPWHAATMTRRASPVAGSLVDRGLRRAEAAAKEALFARVLARFDEHIGAPRARRARLVGAGPTRGVRQTHRLRGRPNAGVPPCRAASRLPSAPRPDDSSRSWTPGAVNGPWIRATADDRAMPGGRHYVEVVAQRLARNFPGAAASPRTSCSPAICRAPPA